MTDTAKEVWITPIDGALPNLALMKLAHWHLAQGDRVTLRRELNRDIFDSEPDIHYASSIFKFSQERLMRFQLHWPKAIIGGTGTPFTHTVEDVLKVAEYEQYHYYDQDFTASIGFSQRGLTHRQIAEVVGKEPHQIANLVAKGERLKSLDRQCERSSGS